MKIYQISGSRSPGQCKEILTEYLRQVQNDKHALLRNRKAKKNRLRGVYSSSSLQDDDDGLKRYGSIYDDDDDGGGSSGSDSDDGRLLKAASTAAAGSQSPKTVATKQQIHRVLGE